MKTATQSSNDNDNPALDDSQYQLVAQRRQIYDSMLWQTPVLSLTAQAFLLNIAFDSSKDLSPKLIAATLAFFTAMASIQLMAKHRYHEVRDSNLLKDYEEKNKIKVIHNNEKAKSKNYLWDCFVNISSYKLWITILVFFGLVSFWLMSSKLLPMLLAWLC